MLESIPRKIQIVVIVAMGVVLFFCVWHYQKRCVQEMRGIQTLQLSQDNPSLTGQGASMDAQNVGEPETVTVHVVGAVDRPGIYTLEHGKRVDDAVKLAGPNTKADLSLLNLAMVLQDSKQICVPTQGEKTLARTASSFASVSSSSSSSGASFASVTPGGKTNINTAGLNELDKLSGIGPALAQRIIDYRNSSGPFVSVEDIVKVSGIGPTLLGKIKDTITVD